MQGSWPLYDHSLNQAAHVQEETSLPVLVDNNPADQQTPNPRRGNAPKRGAPEKSSEASAEKPTDVEGPAEGKPVKVQKVTHND